MSTHDGPTMPDYAKAKLAQIEETREFFRLIGGLTPDVEAQLDRDRAAWEPKP